MTDNYKKDKTSQLIALALASGLVEGIGIGLIGSVFAGKLYKNIGWSIGCAVSANLIVTGAALKDVNSAGSWADLQTVASDLVIGSIAATIGLGISIYRENLNK